MAKSHAVALDRNELGALLVAAGLGPPLEHALISLLALNGLRVSEATGADIEHLGLERGHRTLTITRKGGKVVTVPLAPRTARAIDLAIGERTDGPVFLAADGRRLDRHGAGRIVRKVAHRAGIGKAVTPHTLRHAPSPPRSTLGSRCATYKKPRRMLIREPRCGMTGPAAAWTGMRPKSSPPRSRAPPGNGTPNWRSFARQWQWQRPGEAAHLPDRHGQRPRTNANRLNERMSARCLSGRRPFRSGYSVRPGPRLGPR